MKQKSEEEYVQMDDAAWAPFPEALSTGGITWRLLHVSPDMGSWTAVFECPEGSSFNAHFHTGPGEYFLYKGRTRQTVTAITTAAGVGIGLAVARISVALNPWLILAVMVIVWLYVVTIAWSGWHFILVQRGLRQQWQTKLYRFLSAGDYDAMVTTPVGRSETVFKRTAISGVGVLAAWVACVVVFAFLAAPNSPTAPKPRAQPGVFLSPEHLRSAVSRVRPSSIISKANGLFGCVRTLRLREQYGKKIGLNS